MGVSAIGERTSESFGVEKSNRDPVVDETQQLDAEEYNRVADALIEVQAAIGTTTDPEAGSLEARMVAAVESIGEIETTLASVDAALLTLDSAVSALEAADTSLDSRVDALEAANPTTLIAGAANLSSNSPGSEMVAGGFVFDPATYAGSPSITFLAQAELSTTDASGYLEVRLYDMGTGLTSFSPVLRSVLAIPYADRDQTRKITQALTLSATPGVDDDEVHNVVRAYEIRVFLSSTDEDAIARLVWAGFQVT